MIQSLPGVAPERFAERDFYLSIACRLCQVSVVEAVTGKTKRTAPVTARHAVLWKLYQDGGLSTATAGAMMGMAGTTASQIVQLVSERLNQPRRYPLLARVIKALDDATQQD